MATTRKLLEDIQDSTDLALNFIENEIGGNSFVRNWANAKANSNVEELVANWLKAIGATGDAKDIVDVIDSLATSKTSWLTPFTSPIPPDK